mmetsp:Transcript_3621/g.13358  ORF Transcript_3621/g.13358 Transcript_3621/m.13358 type:complete len:212 (-) Transcript_3621:1298-1933(-)
MISATYASRSRRGTNPASRHCPDKSVDAVCVSSDASRDARRIACVNPTGAPAEHEGCVDVTPSGVFPFVTTSVTPSETSPLAHPSTARSVCASHTRDSCSASSMATRKTPLAASPAAALKPFLFSLDVRFDTKLPSSAATSGASAAMNTSPVVWSHTTSRSVTKNAASGVGALGLPGFEFVEVNDGSNTPAFFLVDQSNPEPHSPLISYPK